MTLLITFFVIFTHKEKKGVHFQNEQCQMPVRLVACGSEPKWLDILIQYNMIVIPILVNSVSRLTFLTRI